MRAIHGLKDLARLSNVLSMQETLDFACAFTDEAVELSSVAVLHDRASRHLVWRASCLGEAPLARATSEVGLSYARMMRAAGGEPCEPWCHDEHSADSRVLTRPLRIPLLGVIRLESAELLRDRGGTFLKQVVILVSLALGRCLDCEPECGVGPGAADCPPARPRQTPRRPAPRRLGVRARRACFVA